MSEKKTPQEQASTTRRKRSYRPIGLLLIIVGSIFCAEALVMFVLSFFPDVSLLEIMFYDAAMLSVLVFPSVYFFVFRPVEAYTCELEQALAEIRILREIIPICAWCKKVRDDKGYWHKVETYISERTDAEFTHGICPECAKKAPSKQRSE